MTFILQKYDIYTTEHMAFILQNIWHLYYRTYDIYTITYGIYTTDILYKHNRTFVTIATKWSRRKLTTCHESFQFQRNTLTFYKYTVLGTKNFNAYYLPFIADSIRLNSINIRTASSSTAPGI